MRQHRRPIAVPDVGSPIASLNTTPLIDVMLVLLIMFIITIPIATDSVKLDLPVGVPPPTAQEPAIHRLAMDADGRLALDGAAVAEAALPDRLAALKAADPLAILHFQVEAQARYDDFDRVLASIKRTGIDRLGFVGQERFAGAF